jgi:hypothetical protein
MAQIKKITRQSVLSNQQQGAPQGGGAFKLLADGLNEIYDRVAPVALDQMTQTGERLGRESARAQFGSERPYQKQSRVSGGGVDTLSGSQGDDDIAEGIREAAQELGVDPEDVATAISYETGGTFDPQQKGPTTQWGQHEGFIQFGQPQQKQYGVDLTDRQTAIRSQLGAKGAIVKYLRATGVKPGMGLLDIYSAINAGGVGRYNRSDANNGGAPGSVADKVNNQMAGHRANAIKILSAGGGDVSLAGGTSAPAEPAYEAPTMVRTSSGALESRLYSPYSGPLLQAHDAAAKIAYQSEVLNKSAVDLMDMSEQFKLDPEGYQGAAEQYVDALVDSAPTDYQGELRGTLEKQVRQRAFGLMEERHRDVRQRANNSSAALVDRWSGALTDAILTGDQGQIDEAQTELDSLLQAREALPGLSWTTEQSANVVIKSRKAAEVKAAKIRVEQGKKTKATLDLIIKGAQAGANVAGEEILNDPAAIADHPELAREAAANVALRDNMPDFLEMTPQEQIDAIAQLTSQEVVEEWQLDIVKAAGEAAKANQKAWIDDPVKQASVVLKNDPPPPLPEITLDDPQKITAGLAARRDYMNRIREQGYTDVPAFLSQAEADGLEAVMSADSPPEVRAAIAGAIVGGFGPDAVSVFDEIGGDKVTMFAGKMMSLGGNPTLATTMLKGQQLIDEGLVRVPPKADRIDQFSKATAAAFDGTTGGPAAQAEVMAAAQAIYAADPSARGIEPTSEAATALMEGSIQKALGQSKNKRGQTTGGVQPVMGSPTLMPVGISGEAVNDALSQAFGVEPNGILGRFSKLARGPGSIQPLSEESIWPNGAPSYNGKPIPKSYIRDGGIRIVPYRGSQYRIEIMTGSGGKPAEDENGNIFFFDMKELMDNAP